MRKILMATSEASPFAKTGGLADVLGSLPSALSRQGAEVRVIMPQYGTILPKFKEKIKNVCYIFVRVGWRNVYCGINQTEYNGITYYLLDNEYYFKRDELYGYGDDGERFAFFCLAVLEALPFLDYLPEVLHCHDWQSGMIPVLLEAHYRQFDSYRKISTVFTIHNLRYQGVFGIDNFKDWFALGNEYFTSDKLEFHGGASFLKGGLVYSHVITTVSPSYAEEIKNSFYGENMDGLLNARNNDLHGIINGIDYDEFNPKNDPLITQTYTKTSIKSKELNKTALQQELNLPVGEDIPMIGLISRLVDQKGLDLIACVLDEILSENVQFVILGTGDIKYEGLLMDAAFRHQGKLSANIRFDNVMAHKIYAGADLFLMPSLFEPCGLGQMISLRYGTLPIVRETGGLKDTILSYREDTGEGNGFSFEHYNAHEMLFTIQRALRIYKNKTIWNKLRKAAMSCDYSWQSSADQYIKLYETMRQQIS